ncbi:hypothetical protein KSP40_PGU009009 [Platanthera guangdongensis]|uniref:Uncharacterized protein n=1 Tax=Platanthera guangdongensis TaxID=2320717 RepID=A0ABR2LBK5_9ASPA
MDEGMLRKVSGRLFSCLDFGTRQSTRLSGDAMTNSSLHASQTGANVRKSSALDAPLFQASNAPSLLLDGGNREQEKGFPQSSGALSHESGVQALLHGSWFLLIHAMSLCSFALS